MSDTPNDPQPIDPPVNTGGGGTASEQPEDTEIADSAETIDPPVNTGGGGGA